MSRKQMVGGLLGAVVSLFGCTAKPEEPQIVERTEIDGDRILIAYYSWGGNTRAAAEALQTLTDGTLLELRPATPYPDSYLKCVAQAKGECRSGACPPLEPLAVDPAAYDVIFVGTPNWWGTLAPPVRTFLTQAELSGKTVIPGKLRPDNRNGVFRIFARGAAEAEAVLIDHRANVYLLTFSRRRVKKQAVLIVDRTGFK